MESVLIECLLVPDSNATPEQLRQLAQGMIAWRRQPANNCAWLEHGQMLDMFAGKQPRSLSLSHCTYLAEMEPTERERSLRAWAFRDRFGLSFAIRQVISDRPAVITILQTYISPERGGAGYELYIDGE
jgi:hypothetical protein